MGKLNEQQVTVSPALFAWMQEIRQTIHQNPELSRQETATAAYICAKLDEIGVTSYKRVIDTGIVVDIGKSDGGLSVGLRADMDALPIQEATGLPFASANPGIMHACGHDGHVAMLLGAATLLQHMALPGRVRLIFQPAEESGNGADKMVQAGAIDGLSAIFAGHIDTHYPTGTITVDEGIVCAYADPFIITLTGRSGHAARPHECKDTIVAAAGLITSMQSIVAREVDPNHAAVITVGTLRAGTILNVVAGEAVIEGTIRSTNPEARNSVISALKRKVAGNADSYGIKANLDFPPCLPAVINSSTTAGIAGVAASAIVQDGNVMSQGPSSLGGEDFAFYQQEIQGCLVRFGAKLSDETGHAHSPLFDFDEKVLPVGASWYAEVARRFLQE